MAWAAGERVTAGRLNAMVGSVAARDETDITGVTSTTFAAGSPSVGSSFTTPESGSVFVTVSARISSAGADTNPGFLGFRIGTGATVGAGTEVLAASVERSTSSLSGGASQRYRADGLTANTVHNVQAQHRAGTGSTQTFHWRSVHVEPAF